MQISSRAVMFWGCRWATQMLKDPATFYLQCPCWWKEVFTKNLTIHGPIHSFLYTDQSSWSLCRKTAPKHYVSTPMLHSRHGVLWMQLSILSPPNTTSWVFTNKFYFGFIWPYAILPILFWIIQMLSSKLQTGLDMYWLKQGDTSGTAGFESLSFLILSLIVEVYLWWKLQASLIFLSGRTCTIGGWLNTFLPHCMYPNLTNIFCNIQYIHTCMHISNNVWLYMCVYILIYSKYNIVNIY